MNAHESQNKRMRQWFEERTGLKNALLSKHMRIIDKMLAIQQEPQVSFTEPNQHFCAKCLHDDGCVFRNPEIIKSLHPESNMKELFGCNQWHKLP